MKAVVTGAGGFLGGAIARTLSDRGDEVKGFSRGKHTELAGDGIEQHQPFVDRNLARLREVGTWDARVAELLQVLAERGYEVPRGE